MEEFKHGDLEIIENNTPRQRREIKPSTGYDVGAKIAEIKQRGKVGRVVGTVLETVYDVRRVMWR